MSDIALFQKVHEIPHWENHKLLKTKLYLKNSVIPVYPCMKEQIVNEAEWKYITFL